MKIIVTFITRCKLVPICLLTTLSLFLSISSGCQSLTSQARGEMSNLRCEDTSRIVNGQFDYGFNVVFTVKNTGQLGAINVKAELSTSEGEWQREQNLNFTAGESQTLTYFFDEPTINVNNPQCKVRVFPQAN